MNPKLALIENEYAVVHAILQMYLPGSVTVHVFGSRASGLTKPWSDLDLVLEDRQSLPLSLIATLAEAFEESALPWKVDIVDRMTVSDGFGHLIDQSKVAFF